MRTSPVLNPRSIYQARLRAGYSQEDVAHALRRHGGFKTTADSVAKWERGINTPRANVIPALASVLGVSIDAMYSSDDEEEDAQVASLDVALRSYLRQLIREEAARA